MSDPWKAALLLLASNVFMTVAWSIRYGISFALIVAAVVVAFWRP